jgi:undecaprenyl-diphosphatase
MAKRLGLSEAAVLVTLALIVSGIWTFMEIADEVTESAPMGFDQRVMSFLHDPQAPGRPIGPAWLLNVAKDITALGSYAVVSLLGLIVLVFFGLKRQNRLMLLTIAAAAGGGLMSTLLKLLFARQRPDIEHLVQVSTYSFPSGHAMLSAVVYITLGALLARSEKQKRFKIFFLLVAVLLAVTVGISRIYLGVHYPTDVMAGWIAGAVWALFCLFVADMIQRHFVPDSGAPP